jgi:hypothetical protein
VNFRRAFFRAGRYNPMLKSNPSNQSASTPATANSNAGVRLRRAIGDQIIMNVAYCDDLIPEGHQARVLWTVV